MLTGQRQRGGNPQFESIVNALVSTDVHYAKNEMRTVHRENIVLPVSLSLKDGRVFATFSRNISSNGVCLIGPESIDENRIADLNIYRLGQSPLIITSESRWCRPFGEEYFMSGWKFLSLKRN